MRIKMWRTAKLRNPVNAAHGTVAGWSRHVPVALVACSLRQARRIRLRPTQPSQVSREGGREPPQTELAVVYERDDGPVGASAIRLAWRSPEALTLPSGWVLEWSGPSP